MFFNKTNKSNKGILKTILSDTVNISMAVVNVSTLTSKIRKTAIIINDLVSTTASASEEMASTVQGIAGHASDASTTASEVVGEVREAIDVMQSINKKMGNTI